MYISPATLQGLFSGWPIYKFAWNFHDYTELSIQNGTELYQIKSEIQLAFILL